MNAVSTINVEGPLSKWTNLMKGWQYRWFVVDERVGILSYYTSKEKRVRESRRGFIKLEGAVIGIDDEDDSTFTITVDKKTFHFQAKDADEKEHWIRSLENTIRKQGSVKEEIEIERRASVTRFDRKLVEADAYLKILIEQVKELELKIEDCVDNLMIERYLSLKNSAEMMIESIKQSIVLLQISKHVLREKYETPREALKIVTLSTPSPHRMFGVSDSERYSQQDGNGDLQPQQQLAVKKDSTEVPLVSSPGASPLHRSAESVMMTSDNRLVPDNNESPATLHQSHSSSLPNLVTPTEEFSTIDMFRCQNVTSADGRPIFSLTTSSNGLEESGDIASDSCSEDGDFYDAEEGRDQSISSFDLQSRTSPKVISSQDDYFDELYDDEDEETIESMESHGSLVTHLLSQLRIGMDLTKVVLPTFILERRSLLEMYSDFFAHPDLFVSIADQKSPRDRFVQCVRWYLSAFHAGRKSAIAKKPYNPILGETFQCVYELSGTEDSSQEMCSDGPVPWCKKSNLAFIAEQVSHHPPISAFYVECHDKRISLDGYIWTKSKFLGLSIGVHMIGQAVISVLDYEEDYILTFPNAYGRSILTVPWMEMGGKINITCPKTGYNATVDFHTKPFYGGKKDQITAELFMPNDRKSFCTVKGEWNGIMMARQAQALTQNEIFFDTKNSPIIKKQVKPIDKQSEFESRRLWREVTVNLKRHDVEAASECKRIVEQRQRDEAQARKLSGTKYETRCFHEVGEHWVYDRPLVKRLSDRVTFENCSNSDVMR